MSLCFNITKHFSWRQGKLMLFAFALRRKDIFWVVLFVVLHHLSSIYDSKNLVMVIWYSLCFISCNAKKGVTYALFAGWSVCLKCKVNRLIKMFCFSAGKWIKNEVDSYFYECVSHCHDSGRALLRLWLSFIHLLLIPCFTLRITKRWQLQQSCSEMQKWDVWLFRLSTFNQILNYIYLFLSDSIFFAKLHKKHLFYKKILLHFKT